MKPNEQLTASAPCCGANLLHNKIGKVKDKEIDFIAKRENDVSYYQVAYKMGDESTREREFGVYKAIKDNFPKYVLSLDSMDFTQDGIIHKNIIDFLLEYGA